MDRLGPFPAICKALYAGSIPVAASNEFSLVRELGRFHEPARTSLGNVLRIHAGGEIDMEVPADPVVGPLAALLRDAYPLMLVPADRTFFPRLHLSGALWSSPHRKSFEDGVLADPVLSRLFMTETESGGWTSMVYRSTGTAGSLQLWSLPNLLLTGAWWSGQLAQVDERDGLIAQLELAVDLLRRCFRGEGGRSPRQGDFGMRPAVTAWSRIRARC